MKSHSRAPTFLMLTGYEQIRSAVCALTGNQADSAEVRLVLPEAGICSTTEGGLSWPAASATALELPLTCCA